MTSALALVVDDSRMARHMLSKMLKEQGIDVDTVESGEEALGYLCDKMPTMIFMDHTMPGMDGFQTLRAIKNDPHTAAIPIIMYTSKEGEVYESQARALGAVDVIPKSLKPLQLAKVLERQNLLPGQAPLPVNVAVVGRPAANDVVIVATTTPDSELPLPSLGAGENRPVNGRNYSKPKELSELENRLQQLTEQIQQLNSQPGEFRTARRNYRLQFVGLAICIVAIGSLLFYNTQISRQVADIRVENASLKQAMEQRSSPVANAVPRAQNAPAATPLRQPAKAIQPAAQERPQVEPERVNRRFYDSMVWAFNREGQFGFDEKPFSEKLAGNLIRLAENLQSAGFHGEISVLSHLGRFCTQMSPSSEPVLPEEGQTMSSCEVMEFDPDNMENLGKEQTPGFAEFLASFEPEFGENMHLSLATAGDRRPLARYPRPDPDMEAARWNAVAARNQRIEVSIRPQ